MPAHGAIGRRELLKLLAAAGAGGVVGTPSLAVGSQASKFPAGTLMIGTGGAGCKVVRRAIGLGFDPGGFVTIDADAEDLSASGAGHQIQCRSKRVDRGWPTMFEEGTHVRLDELLQQASKVVLVGGLGIGMGGNWLWTIATGGGLAERHIAERGLQVEVVATMPRWNEPDIDRVQGAYMFRHIRLHRSVKTRVDCNKYLPLNLPPCSVLERELWLTRQALLCALDDRGRECPEVC